MTSSDQRRPADHRRRLPFRRQLENLRTSKKARAVLAVACLILVAIFFGSIPHRDGPPTVRLVQPAEAQEDFDGVDTTQPGPSSLPTGPPQAEAASEPQITSDVEGEQGGPLADGVKPYALSSDPVISADGRFVAFNSHEPGSHMAVFVYDRRDRTFELANVGNNGAAIRGYVGDMSDDGRFVVFLAYADDHHVYVRDRLRKRTIRASESTSGEPANDGTFTNNHRTVSISGDGRYVAFHSAATNLVPGDTNNSTDAFVRDVVAETTTRVSVSSAGEQADSPQIEQGGGVEISDDGRYVVFASYAPNLVSDPIPMCPWAGDEIPCQQVYVHDRHTGSTTLVSVSPEGSPGDGHSNAAWISDDGRYVSFESHATNLAPDHEEGAVYGYLRDRRDGTTAKVSTVPIEGQIPKSGGFTQISPDGAFLAFFDQHPGADWADPPRRVRDMDTGTERELEGAQMYQRCAFSSDGSFIVYTAEHRLRLYRWSSDASEWLF